MRRDVLLAEHELDLVVGHLASPSLGRIVDRRDDRAIIRRMSAASGPGELWSRTNFTVVIDGAELGTSMIALEELTLTYERLELTAAGG